MGLEGVRGVVAERKASRRRTPGVCLEHQSHGVTFVPRTCAVRQALAAWGRAHPAWPLLVEKPGRTQAEAPRRWHGQSVLRQVEVEYRDGRIAQETLRLHVVHARQLAQQHTQASGAAHAKTSEAVAAHVRQGQARWFACRPAAAAAIAADEGRGPGRRGAAPRPWRSHTVR